MNSGKIREMVSCLIANGYTREEVESFCENPITEEAFMENPKKTIEQWLKEGLTPEQFENAKKCKYVCWEVGADCLSKAIRDGFWWGDMPEGYFHWEDYVNDLEFRDK